VANTIACRFPGDTFACVSAASRAAFAYWCAIGRDTPVPDPKHSSAGNWPPHRTPGQRPSPIGDAAAAG